MRYADQPSTEAEIVIAAPAPRVWDLVCDIQLPAQFSSEFQGAEWITGEPGQPGAQFKGRSYHSAMGEWETVSTVTESEPERVFAWAVGEVDHPSTSWRFAMEPVDGGIRLRQWMQMGPARSGINVAIDAMPDKEARILQRRLAEHRQNMEATLAGIKGLAERAAKEKG